MSAAEQPQDDPVTRMVERGITLRSAPVPPDTPWYDAALWGIAEGFFGPAERVGESALLMAMLVTALQTEATHYRHAQRQKTVEEGLTLLRGGGAPLQPQPAPAPPPAPPVALPKLGTPLPVPPLPPVRHLLDGYAMAKWRRDLTLGSMTLDDYEQIKGRLRAATLGQARLEAQVALVAELARARGAAPHQPFREVMTDTEAAEALVLADQVRDQAGADLEHSLAHVVATNALFGRGIDS